MIKVDKRRPIVVGIDGSANSLAALRWALQQGSTTNAPVEVVHCWTAQTVTDAVFAKPAELMTASIRLLQNEVDSAVAEMPEPPSTMQLSLPGSPASILIERAARARLLVLGVRQSPAMRDLTHGAVGSACARHATCPIVSVDRRGHVAWHHPNRHGQLASR